MARQSNKSGSRSNTTKRRTTTVRKKKKQSTDRSVIIGGFLIALLLGMVAFGVYSISNDKDAAKQAKTTVTKEKTVADKPAPKKETVAKEQAKAQVPPPAVPVVETPKVKQAPQPTEQNEDITAVIRLVLYDYEISRASVVEKTSKDTDGKKMHSFNVATNTDTASRVKDTLRSVLTKKGYKVKLSAGKITAIGKKDSVTVAFAEAAKSATAKNEPEKKPAPVAATAQTKTAEKPKYPTPPAASDRVVKMAILLDDGGNSYELAERFAKSKYPMAIAILPHLQDTKESARICSAYGKTIFLHYPMQPKSYPNTDPGEGAALVSMPEILIDAVTKKNFEALGVHIDGFNNHMGSAITEDAAKMAQIFKTAKNYTDTFVDSRTTEKSVAYDECVKAGMRCGINRKFIDNDNDVNTIIEMIYEAAEIAKKDGEVLVIGHIRPKTLEALEIALPILENRRIAVVPLKTMVR